MAMSDEELLLQMNILASKTEDNPNMVYKANATLNKGLNPEYFTGNNTKIVNAINHLAETSVKISDLSEAVADKVNELLLDTSSDANKAIWDNVKELMEMDTIIEGIQRILEGKQQLAYEIYCPFSKRMISDCSVFRRIRDAAVAPPATPATR